VIQKIKKSFVKYFSLENDEIAHVKLYTNCKTILNVIVLIYCLNFILFLTFAQIKIER